MGLSVDCRIISMTSLECECDDEVDIYGDLPNVPCIGDTVKELEETKKVLEDEVTRLKEKLEEVTTKKNQLESKNKCLGLNISTLYKTASAEIERKDRLIADLRREKDNIIFRRWNKSFSKEVNCTSGDSGDYQCSQDVAEQNHRPAVEAEPTEFHFHAAEIEHTEFHHQAPEIEQTKSPLHAPEIEQTKSHHHAPEIELTKSHHHAPEIELTKSHHHAPEIEETESSYADTDISTSNKLSTHMNVPPENVLTLYSRRCLHMIPKNNKFISLDKSNEVINQESEIPWNLIPITDTKPYKDINGKVYNTAAHLNQEYDSFSQNESKRKVRNSENSSYLSYARNTVHTETNSERIYNKAKESSLNSCKYISRTRTRQPVPRHLDQGDEHKSYSQHKVDRYLHSENYRSRSHLRYISEHLSHSKRWKFYKIPRITRETSLSRALRSLRSRSRSVSQSRTVPGSIQNSAKRSYSSKASSQSRSSVLTDMSDRHTDLALKVADSDACTLQMKTQLPTQLEMSKDGSCEPQKKFTPDAEPCSLIGASGVELQRSLETAKTEPVVKILVSTAGSKCRSGSATLFNLSEHSTFKRSKMAKIVGLNTEIKPIESKTTDLVKNTNIKLFSEHNQSGGVKRPLETNETDEVHLQDFKRQVLNDITGRECYNYIENDNGTDHKQLYNGTVKKQPSSGSVNENTLKNNQFSEDKSDEIKNVEITVVKENKAKQQKEETVSQNINLDAEQPTVENMGITKETVSSTSKKSGSPKLNETDISVANQSTDHHHGEHVEFRFERNSLDTKRKSSDSCRPQRISQSYRERSRTPVTLNSHCKRRSPSELLNKDRAGRRLSNQVERAKTERSRSRSRSFEGTRTYREPVKCKITDSVDGKGVRYLASDITSEEQRKKNKYSKGDNKKSDSSQNCTEKTEKQKVKANDIKQHVTRQKEDCGRNIPQMVVLEITTDHTAINSKIHDGCGRQTELVRIMESTRLATLNEIEMSGHKALQHGPSTVISVDPSNLNEIIKTYIPENNQNFLPTSKSVEISTSRSNNHDRGSQVPISTENNISSDCADLQHGTCGMYKVGSKDKIRRSKEFKDKNMELCINNPQNNENKNNENRKNSTEVGQTKVSSTEERLASGQDKECNRNIQKENLTANNMKDHVRKGYPQHQIVPDGKINTENENNRETEFKNAKAKQNINKLTIEQGIKKKDHTSDKKESKISQHYRRNKKIQDHETEVGVPEESKVNRKRESCNESIQQVDALKKDEDNGFMNSNIQENCQHTKEKLEFSVSSAVNKNQNSNFKKSLLPKEIIAQLPVCNEASEIKKAKKTATSSRKKQRQQEKKMLEEFELTGTSDIKCVGHKTKKAVSEEIHYKKQCERTIKIPNKLQKHKDRGQNEECGTEVAQIEVNNAEERRKQKKDSSDAEKISFLETYKGDGISVSKIKSGHIGQTESPADEMEDVTAGIICKKEKFSSRDSKCALSKQSVLGSSVSDEVNISENEKDKETVLSFKIHTNEIIPTVSEKCQILDSVDQKDSKHRSSGKENHENEKTTSNSCQNYERDKKENNHPRFYMPQTDANNTKENETGSKYENCSETVRQTSVFNKNIGDGVTNTKAHHAFIGDIKSTVARVNDATQSAVHIKQKSDCQEFKHVSSSHAAEVPLTCNENGKGRIRRSRSRSCQNGSELIRGLKTHKVADCTNETGNTESEGTKTNKYCKDESVLSISQNDEKMMAEKDFEVEAAQREANNVKYIDIRRMENENNKNVQKSCLPESTRGNDTVEPEIQNCAKAQRKSLNSMNDVTLNEKGDADYEMQDGTCKEPITEASVSHEVSEERAVVISHKPTNDSVELTAVSSKVSPVIKLKFRARKSAEVKLEDSKAVLSVNITPPKKETSVLIVKGVGTSTVGINCVSETQKSVEDRNNGQNVNVSCNNGGTTNCNTVEEVPKDNGTDTSHSMIVGDNATVDHKLKKNNIKTKHMHETQNVHEVNFKTDLNLRSKCQSIFCDYSHECDDASKELDFDSSSSFINFEQNSDNLQCPKGRQTKKSKSQQNESNVCKTEQKKRK